MVFLGIIKTKGIVINEANSKDNDKVLTILTPDLGKISVIAKGVRREKNINKSASQLFVFSELVLYKNTGDMYILNSADTIEQFYNIRIDIEKFYYVTYMCKLICDVSTSDEENAELMQLLLNTIYLLEQNKKDNMFLITVFQIRLLRILGFMPILNKCVNCQSDELHHFSIKYNGLLCNSCAKQDTGSIEFSLSMINALKYILLSDAKKIYSFEISNMVLSELKLFIKIYLREKLEREYDIDKYLKDILM
ncbi:MAG: DNA repair protein RecO [Clostridiales bacterium]|nr:DNA repair protein RecO [Clostridiales bacterium]